MKTIVQTSANIHDVEYQCFDLVQAKGGELKMKIYRAEYADENVMEIIIADNDMDALNEAWEMEKEHGTLFNLALLDEDYNVVREVL